MNNKDCTFNFAQHILVIGRLPNGHYASSLDSLNIFKDFYRGIRYLSNSESESYNEMTCTEIKNSLNCDLVAFLSHYDPSKAVSYIASDFFSDWLKTHIQNEKLIDSFYKNVVISRYKDLIRNEEKENKLFFEYFLGG